MATHPLSHFNSYFAHLLRLDNGQLCIINVERGSFYLFWVDDLAGRIPRHILPVRYNVDPGQIPDSVSVADTVAVP